MACCKVFDKTVLRLAFEVLPQVSQMIFGGEPKRSRSETKSLSLVITTTFTLFASRKISSSSASRKPKSRRAKALTSKLLSIQTAIAGESYASTQIVMRQSRRRDSIYAMRIADTPANLQLRDQAFLRESVPPSNLPRTNPKHPLPESASRAHTDDRRIVSD